MSHRNITFFRTKQSRSEVAAAEAATWLARLRAPDLGEQELEKFDGWLESSALNRSEFSAIEELWRISAELATDPAFADVLGRDVGTVGKVAPSAARWKSPIAIGIMSAAAACLVLVFVSVNANSTAPAEMVYKTERGEQLRVTLTDGSRLLLDAQTQLIVSYTTDERRIALTEGRSFFEVSKDPSRPFYVSVNNTNVRAVGTSFSVGGEGGQVSVIVVEGQVEVSSKEPRYCYSTVGCSENLVAGEKGIVSAANEIEVSRPVDVDRDVSWRHGRIILDQMSIADAVAEFQRYVERDVVFADPEIADMKVSGVFETSDFDAFLSATSQYFGLALDYDGARVVISVS